MSGILSGGGGGVGGSGTSGKVARFTGTATLADSTISDTGTKATISNLNLPEQDLGLLGSGPLDLDLSAYPNKNVFKFTCPIGGTVIRSVKRTISTTGVEETITLKNMSSNVKPGDNLCIFTQDDPSGVYQHLHLEARQPWHVLPALAAMLFRLDSGQNKWFAQHPLSFGNQMRPIPITFSLASGVQDDIDPVDNVTGVSGRYVNWWRVIPVAGTIWTGIASAVTAGTNWSREIRATNYGGVSCTVADNNAGGGASAKPFRIPGGSLTWRAWSTIRFLYDEGNTLWLVEGV